MRPSRFTEEQIIAMLKEQEAGAATADVCRKHGISSGTFYKFKVSAKGPPRSGSGVDLRFFALFGVEGSADGNFCIYAYA